MDLAQGNPKTECKSSIFKFVVLTKFTIHIYFRARMVDCEVHFRNGTL